MACTYGCFGIMSLFCPLAVQCERKPVEVTTREKSVNCAASTEKIYIRKNLCSPLAATPTFVSDKETARYSHERKNNTLIYYLLDTLVQVIML